MDTGRDVKKRILIAMVAVGVAISSTILGLAYKQGQMLRKQTHSQATALFDLILLTRRWNADHGGVFVEKRPGVISNPYLENPDIRDVNGTDYTKKNPALMTREISEYASLAEEFTFHITSLRPKNPNNAADPWEAGALTAFESGETERVQISDQSGQPYYRLIKPLYVEKACLSCHMDQGYRTGDVRGGISVNIPFRDTARALQKNFLAMTMVLITLLIFFALILYFFIWKLLDRLSRQKQKLKESYQTIKAHQEQLIEELEQARTTQLSLLPPTLPNIPNAQVAAKYVPMEEVGGDFYDIFELEPNVFGLLVADVTGHGVSAALLSFMFYSMFFNARNSGKSPETTVRLTNEYVSGKVEQGKFATMFYAVYNASTQQLTYTGAGHPAGFVIRPSSDEIIELDTKGILVGFFAPKNAEFEEKTIQLQPKDKVLLYTDGIVEVLDGQEEMLGSARLKSFLLENKHSHIEELVEKVYQLGSAFCEHRGFDDDITLVGLEVT